MTDINLREITIFEDDYLIALNKPAGLLSIEDGYDSNKLNLRTALKEFYGSIWAVHRLDKDTSGVIIFAKDVTSHRKLNSAFSEHLTTKRYRGIINGVPIWLSYEINLPLLINGDKEHRTVIGLTRGKSAITRFSVIDKFYRYSYLDIFPESGFTHQIRAHLSAAGFPILGDNLYDRACKLNYKDKVLHDQEYAHFFLHAYSLTFPHPVLNIYLDLTAPLPIMFSNLLSKLEIVDSC
jgi:tRNA pseudouridine32 synthase / 23S rRNA pseudouridine746 synthase